MNNKKINTLLRDFSITIIVSIILAISCALIFELELLFRCEKKVNFEELKLKNLSKFYTISQLEKLAKQNPQDSVIYIKIANIYTSLKEYANAQKFYEKALVVSKRSNFSLYSYALFCAKYGLLNNATSLAEEISANNSKTFEFRAEIYEAIADSLDNLGYFEGANKSYQIAYKYAKNIDDKKLANQIREKYALSYTKLADEKINSNKIEDAILDLKNSIEIYSNPVAKYKLALIYKDIDKKTSERYFSQTLRQNPYLVNPEIYNNLLNKLYNEANLKGSDKDIDYYSNQLKKLNKKLKNAYLYKNDISITSSKIIKKKKFYSKEANNYLNFNLKNNTDSPIKELYFEIQLISGTKTHKIEKKLTTKLNPYLKQQDILNLDAYIDGMFLKNNLNNNIYAKYYCKKDKKAPWTLIAIQKVDI